MINRYYYRIIDLHLLSLPLFQPKQNDGSVSSIDYNDGASKDENELL